MATELLPPRAETFESLPLRHQLEIDNLWLNLNGLDLLAELSDYGFDADAWGQRIEEFRNRKTREFYDRR
jgi:hypothetical protein